MYQGNNPTAINSRDWLINALLSLMETRPYSKITVKDICAKADLSRQTFYNFFETKDDIIRYRIHKCYDEMMEELNQRPALLLSDITEQLTKTFLTNGKLINLILSQNLDHLLEFELASIMNSFAARMNPESSGHPAEYGTAFLAGAIAHVIIFWFKDAQPVPAAQLADLLSDILTGNYYQIKTL